MSDEVNSKVIYPACFPRPIVEEVSHGRTHESSVVLTNQEILTVMEHADMVQGMRAVNPFANKIEIVWRKDMVGHVIGMVLHLYRDYT